MFTVDCQPNHRVRQIQSGSKLICQIAKMQMKLACYAQSDDLPLIPNFEICATQKHAHDELGRAMSQI